ncbi:MAG: class II aldolase/adducin family protein [Hyphomicrobiales bacterium]|nr:class II aldolase/adducin family protein [Hyphomicrobiales bacterium]
MLARAAFAAACLCAALGAAPAAAQVAPKAIAEDLAVASRILADQGVVDAFGHVSMRNPNNPRHFFMSRSLAPALTTPADIMEFDENSNPVDAQGRTPFLERFIHGEIYRKRPDVMAVVHSHSPTVIPFGVTKTPMAAMFHNAAFLADGAPVFDIAEKFGATNMLVSNNDIGAALADKLGEHSVALMRGHGDAVVGPTLQIAVFRAIYTEVDAKMMLQAITIGGPIQSLSHEEGAKADKVNEQIVGRAWDLWKRRVEKTP